MTGQGRDQLGPPCEHLNTHHQLAYGPLGHGGSRVAGTPSGRSWPQPLPLCLFLLPSLPLFAAPLSFLTRSQVFPAPGSWSSHSEYVLDVCGAGAGLQVPEPSSWLLFWGPQHHLLPFSRRKIPLLKLCFKGTVYFSEVQKRHA